MTDARLLELALTSYYLFSSKEAKRLAEMVVEREDALVIMRQDGSEAQEQAKLDERRRIAAMIRERSEEGKGFDFWKGEVDELLESIEKGLPPTPSLCSELLERIRVLSAQVKRCKEALKPFATMLGAWFAHLEFEEGDPRRKLSIIDLGRQGYVGGPTIAQAIEAEAVYRSLES